VEKDTSIYQEFRNLNKYSVYKGHTRTGKKKTKIQGLVSVLQSDEQGEARGVK
jgi:hypothetical protein